MTIAPKRPMTPLILFVQKITDCTAYALTMITINVQRCFLMILCFAFQHSIAQATEPIDEVSYNFDIRPILSDNCFFCHGPDAGKREAGLRLDTAAGGHGPLKKRHHLVPFSPHDIKKSYAFQRIIANDPVEIMPPEESHLSLSDDEKGLIAKWIQQGAKYETHWAYKSIGYITPPNVSKSLAGSANNEIDQFVLSRLETNQLQPAKPAPLATYIRRVSFDLTGLPPTLTDLDRFLAKQTDNDIHAQIVEHYLSLPTYGERLASEWLDVARFSDTYGYLLDRYRDMSAWRDWVIKVFNNNMPYDQFVTEQLAGDLLPNATDDQILATAFNRNHKQTEEGGSIDEEFRVAYVADRTETFGTAFLGLTVGCAKCHDHKFDAISQKEYFQLTAYFDNIDELGQIPFSGFVKLVSGPTLLLADKVKQKELASLHQAVVTETQRVAEAREVASGKFEQWFNANGNQQVTTATPVYPEIYVPKHLETTDAHQARQDRSILLDGDSPKKIKGDFKYDAYQPFSIVYWAYIPNTFERAVMVHYSKGLLDAARHGYEMTIVEGKLNVILAHQWPGNAIDIISADTLPINQWVQIGFTSDGSMQAGGIGVYVDGKPIAVNVLRNHLSQSIVNGNIKAASLTLGARFRDSGFKGGRIADLHVFKEALTEIEIATLYRGVEIVAMDNAFTSAQWFDYYFNRHYALDHQLVKPLFAARKALIDTRSAVPEIQVMAEMSPPRTTYLLNRGAYDQRGDVVTPKPIAAINNSDKQYAPNRLGLAQWLVDPKNALTARVTVNRYWQMIFGKGLVSTPQDFGNQGHLPTHPQLLDWLAKDFVAHGWDLKRLLKKILLSGLYRQSSLNKAVQEIDPHNVLLACYPKNRLTAEMTRDQVLMHSGLLVNKIGGRSVKPYLPASVWTGARGSGYKRDKGDKLYRRSLYTYWRRTFPPPNMMIFDTPQRSVCTVQRRNSLTPLQSLVLMNDEQYAEGYKLFAQRLVKAYKDDIDARFIACFRMATSRMPEAPELKILLNLYKQQLEIYKADPEQAKQALSVGDTQVDESVAITQVAASAMVVSIVMNLDEAIYKY